MGNGLHKAWAGISSAFGRLKALQLYLWPLRKYSEFITFPIELFNEKVQYDQVPDESAPPPKEGEKQKMKSVPRSVYEWDIMNKMKSTGICTDLFFLRVSYFLNYLFYSTVWIWHRPSQNSSPAITVGLSWLCRCFTVCLAKAHLAAKSWCREPVRVHRVL